jgi:TM2 domain-containing membrane protein YozV
MDCRYCTNEIPDGAAICPKCGISTAGATSAPVGSPKKRVVYVLLGLLLGGLGIHNFYAGYKKTASIQLLIMVLTGWLIIPAYIVVVWALLEVLTVKTDNNGNAFV